MTPLPVPPLTGDGVNEEPVGEPGADTGQTEDGAESPSPAAVSVEQPAAVVAETGSQPDRTDPAPSDTGQPPTPTPTPTTTPTADTDTLTADTDSVTVTHSVTGVPTVRPAGTWDCSGTRAGGGSSSSRGGGVCITDTATGPCRDTITSPSSTITSGGGGCGW